MEFGLMDHLDAGAQPFHGIVQIDAQGLHDKVDGGVAVARAKVPRAQIRGDGQVRIAVPEILSGGRGPPPCHSLVAAVGLALALGQVQFRHPHVEVHVGCIVQQPPKLVVALSHRLKRHLDLLHRLLGDALDRIREPLQIIRCQHRQVFCRGVQQRAGGRPDVGLAGVGVDRSGDHRLPGVGQKLHHRSAEALGADRREVEGGVAAAAFLAHGRIWQRRLKLLQDVVIVGVEIDRHHDVFDHRDNAVIENRERHRGAGDDADVGIRPVRPDLDQEFLRLLMPVFLPAGHAAPLAAAPFGRGLAVRCDGNRMIAVGDERRDCCREGGYLCHVGISFWNAAIAKTGLFC